MYDFHRGPILMHLRWFALVWLMERRGFSGRAIRALEESKRSSFREVVWQFASHGRGLLTQLSLAGLALFDDGGKFLAGRSA